LSIVSQIHHQATNAEDHLRDRNSYFTNHSKETSFTANMKFAAIFTILTMALTAAAAPTEASALAPRNPPPVTSCSTTQTGVCCAGLVPICGIVGVIQVLLGGSACQSGATYCCDNSDINASA
jgi:hypothetical protein